MKNPAYLIPLLLLVLVSCADLNPNPPESNSPVSPEIAAFVVRTYNDEGKVKEEWNAQHYKLTKFPPSVSFVTESGDVLVRSGSFTIDVLQK